LVRYYSGNKRSVDNVSDRLGDICFNNLVGISSWATLILDFNLLTLLSDQKKVLLAQQTYTMQYVVWQIFGIFGVG